MSQSVHPFLMFQGQAEEAVSFYVATLPGGQLLELERYGPGQAGAEGTVRHGAFSIGGQRILFIDSPAKHPFTFTPSSSLFVECASEAQIADLAARLSDGGEVLMELADHGFSRRFAWVNDRFGVSWQLILR
jgi:predicted 3-demethylubiquinone-9 3-methyltransferase (glyoxalase superfamily)